VIRAVPAVSLREITEDNRNAAEALAVTEEQSHYVGSVTKSLQEAEEYPDETCTTASRSSNSTSTPPDAAGETAVRRP
jgi:hypothetical protein